MKNFMQQARVRANKVVTIILVDNSANFFAGKHQCDKYNLWISFILST
jgi:hypothetical protein